MTNLHMKKISLGRADLQVPEDATVSMIGELNDAKLHVDRLPAGKSFAAVWAERVAQVSSGQGNAPGPGETRIRKNYPATATAGQVFYEQSPDPKVLLVMERWQMVGDFLVKGRMEFDPKYGAQAERDMPAIFASMSLDPPRSGADYALGPVTAHYPSQGGESVHAAIHFAVPSAAGGPPRPAGVTLDSELLASAGSITILGRMKQAQTDEGKAGSIVSVPRAHERAIGALPGQEGVLVFTGSTPRQTTVRAEWGTPGVANDASAPQTEVEMVSPDGTSVDPNEMLGYWDAILSSLRYRR